MMAESPFEKYSLLNFGSILGQIYIGEFHRGSGNFLFLDNHVTWMENTGNNSSGEDLELFYQYWWPYVNPLD
jgi:prepilin-type processing-associated H-X9-DG protein